ncbi:adenosylcobinamide-GDP ribazoletransferase [Candidatus Sulfurimonas marisnigri]|uniref:Adenosylcobinamide-GDP ribazoletransferase n=1 Tax=Candidatus Sulfurimonas marisnigri TaxID=2740405 RepID=A0A7S7M0F4_9BACT|nr:adenosylcobinamide-GDP ribazoletransferase [Candidatus Sulfurimonas marisnigri]QOY54744.1 adenosylcobinamide-GDP ribazoletransferase [Candidatus Sulfurimonas marisnigri]
MKNIFRGFALALSMLTTLPFFKVHNFHKGINGHAAMFYPLIGVLLGSILWAAYLLLSPYISSTHLGILIFALWVVLTGALHLDGFSDTIDGLYVDKSKALEVMKEPHVGGMGMILTVTFLILKASSLSLFLTDYEELLYLLPAILMLSRLNAVLAIYNYPYVTPSGMSTLAKEELSKTQMFIALFYSLVLVLMWKGFILLLGSLLVLFVIKRFFIKRYGGFTGDTYGFTIEVTELVLLNIVLFGILS